MGMMGSIERREPIARGLQPCERPGIIRIVAKSPNATTLPKYVTEQAAVCARCEKQQLHFGCHANISSVRVDLCLDCHYEPTHDPDGVAPAFREIHKHIDQLTWIEFAPARFQ